MAKVIDKVAYIIQRIYISSEILFICKKILAKRLSVIKEHKSSDKGDIIELLWSNSDASILSHKRPFKIYKVYLKSYSNHITKIWSRNTLVGRD